MKILLATLLLTNMAFAQFEEYKVPDSCLETQTTITTTTTTVTPDVSAQRAEYEAALKKVMKIMSMIIDIKVEINEYMRENGQLYGKYASSKMLKEEIEAELQSIKENKVSLNDNYLDNIAKIDPNLPKKEIKRITKQLTKTLNNEIRSLNKRQKKLQRRLKRITKDFVKAFKKWAPYQEHVKNLEGLRDSLIEDLKKMKEALKMSEEEYNILITNINTTTTTPGSLNIFCESMSERLRRILEEYRNRVVTPVLIDPHAPRPLIDPNAPRPILDYTNNPLINPGYDPLVNPGRDPLMRGYHSPIPPVNR